MAKKFFIIFKYNMKIQPLSQNNTHNPLFQAQIIHKVRYAEEYIDCIMQKNQTPPNIYRELLPFDSVKAPFQTLLLKSEKPLEDLKEIYELYKQDFSCYHHYLSLKKFKNSINYNNASVFTLKSAKELYGFYTVSIKNDNILYICEIDLNPKYRNTKFGRDIILTCWENINQIAKDNKCSKIALHVDANKKNLVNLYKKLGFEIIENKTRKHNTGQTAYYMEKIVSE